MEILIPSVRKNLSAFLAIDKLLVNEDGDFDSTFSESCEVGDDLAFFTKYTPTRARPSYVYITCTLPVSYLYPTCLLRVSYMCLTCILPVSYVYPTCVLSVSYVYPTCILRVSYVYPTCILRVSKVDSFTAAHVRAHIHILQPEILQFTMTAIARNIQNVQFEK
ncbi:predicted protein [Lodderomyces elongisporus NRRL YB-4239]|uniref:Uncharacterized protein n=1 Tax=Lodderomyces elongisporus (strain ATCC 11503 / CBS 2605 / JCM 1781 / NBRC 1676 / NRRL YB-4239) TaxID=379508 RepID=A5E7L4_LODEL|nr:predicted protein [Lodderomyces elongisporus NRRL YB-4239]